jgi:hypothetical protein
MHAESRPGSERGAGQRCRRLVRAGRCRLPGPRPHVAGPLPREAEAVGRLDAAVGGPGEGLVGRDPGNGMVAAAPRPSASGRLCACRHGGCGDDRRQRDGINGDGDIDCAPGPVPPGAGRGAAAAGQPAREQLTREQQQRERAIAAEREARRQEVRVEAEERERRIAEVQRDVDKLRDVTAGDLGLRIESVVYLAAGIVMTAWPELVADWLPDALRFRVALAVVLGWPALRFWWLWKSRQDDGALESVASS